MIRNDWEPMQKRDIAYRVSGECRYPQRNVITWAGRSGARRTDPWVDWSRHGERGEWVAM
jgi:hypothetical protein